MIFPRIYSTPRQGGWPIHDLGPLLALGGPPWWFLGCRGGAGTSALHAAVPGGMDAGYWGPVCTATPVRVVLVTRSSAHGLRAAQTVAWQWTQSPQLRAVRLHGPRRRRTGPTTRTAARPARSGCRRRTESVGSALGGSGPARRPPGQISLSAEYAASAADLHSVNGGSKCLMSSPRRRPTLITSRPLSGRSRTGAGNGPARGRAGGDLASLRRGRRARPGPGLGARRVHACGLGVHVRRHADEGLRRDPAP